MELLQISWSEIFAVETPVLELVLRATFLYIGILLLMRLMPRRTGGELAIMDLIFIILIAEAAAHALGDYSSVGEGAIVVVTLMGWNYLINVLSYYVPAIEKLVSAPPLQVIQRGKLLRRNMRREYLTEEELTDQLRQQGIEDVKEVKAAFIESDGKLTVLKMR